MKNENKLVFIEKELMPNLLKAIALDNEKLEKYEELYEIYRKAIIEVRAHRLANKRLHSVLSGMVGRGKINKEKFDRSVSVYVDKIESLNFEKKLYGKNERVRPAGERDRVHSPEA